MSGIASGGVYPAFLLCTAQGIFQFMGEIPQKK